MYVQGSPMYTSNDHYFTIPQVGHVHSELRIFFSEMSIVHVVQGN